MKNQLRIKRGVLDTVAESYPNHVSKFQAINGKTACEIKMFYLASERESKLRKRTVITTTFYRNIFLKFIRKLEGAKPLS